MLDVRKSALNIGKPFRHVGRLAQIVQVFARHGFSVFINKVGVVSWLTPEQRRRAEEASSVAPDMTLAEGFRLSLEELGPAFVKFGQMLAVRRDLLPETFIEQLSRLYSDVDTISFEKVSQVLNEELSAELLAKFEHIEKIPLAAGSVGQVHRARLVTGEDIILKIQRPGIEHEVMVDLEIMETLATLVERYLPELRFIQPRQVVKEFARATLGELNYIREAANTTKIAKNFAADPNAVIPMVYWDYTTAKVLALSPIHGFSVWDKARMLEKKLDPALLLEQTVKMFMQMVFIDGYYHGDLHPGNILIMEGHKIGLLDFGVAIKLTRQTREHLAGMFMSLVREDYEAMVLHLVELSEPGASFDLQAFQSDLANTLSPFLGLSLGTIRNGNLLWELAGVAASHGAPFPNELILFLRTLASFEGIAAHLDPDFNVLETCKNSADEIVSQMYSPENIKKEALSIGRDIAYLARLTPYQIRRILKSLLDGEMKLNIASQELKALTKALDKSSSRMAVAIILGSLLIGSSILSFAKVGEGGYNVVMIGTVGFSLAGIMGVYIIISIFRGSGRF